jgi:hypothetical protein
MAYPKHLLMVFGGPMGSKEQWTCSLRLTSSTVSVLPDLILDQLADDYVDFGSNLVVEYLNNLGGRWHESARLGFVKVNGIGPEGLYVGDQTREKRWDTPIAVGQSSSRGPFQLSMAITLGTAKARGLASHGRFYLPAPPLVVDAEGYLDQTTQLFYANQTALFIDSLNNYTGPDAPGQPDVSVVSRGRRTGPKSWSEGTFERVTQIRVGNVMDTQQSRRRSLQERYLFADVAE